MSVLAAAPERAASTTPMLLRRRRAVLIALAILTGAMALLVTGEEHTVVAAGTHTATAVVQAYAAGQALADADGQAVQTIPRGAGPSGQYQADIAAAEQSLEQVAENNTAGQPGTQSLQLIEGLIPAYTALVEQADASFAVGVNGEKGVGNEYLWSASELMHGQILAYPLDSPPSQDSLAELQKSEQDTLAGQRSSPWVSTWLNALWILPAMVLLGTLAVTQRLLYRRMRRVLSKYLALAAAAVIALCATTSHVIVSEHAFSMTSRPLTAVVSLQLIETETTNEQGQDALGQLIERACAAPCLAEQHDAFGIARSDASARQETEAWAKAECGTPEIPGCITEQEGSYDTDALGAESGYGTSTAFVAGLTVLLLLLIPLGLRRYLDEYRQS
jgi:hypothetical protein